MMMQEVIGADVMFWLWKDGKGLFGGFGRGGGRWNYCYPGGTFYYCSFRPAGIGTEVSDMMEMMGITEMMEMTEMMGV